MLELAKVCNVHNGANAVDVLLLRNGQEIPMVQCLCDMAGTNCGVSGFAAPTIKDPNNQYDPQLTNDRDIFAVVGFVGKRPVVLGFLYPQVSQMLFDTLNLRIKRDPSDVYTSVDDTGNTEFYHPSGTYLRIATDTAHKDLTGLDLDQKWKIAKNAGTAVHVHLEVHNAGALKATLDIDPSGNVVLTNSGNLTATVNGTTGATVTTPNGQINLNGVTIDSSGNLHSPGNVSDSVRSMAADRTIYNGHNHNDPQGGLTGVPNQLQ